MDAGAKAAWSAARPGRHPFDTACPAPSVSMEFDPAGWVLACCTGHMYPLGRIGDERLSELWGGPRAQVLRDALSRWDLTVACGPCRWHLEHGRMDPVAAVYDAYPAESIDPARPYMMQFALSNRCNLGCVMCNPELSSRLRTEAGIAPLESRYDDQFFEDLAPLLDGLRLAKFQGGEPFLIPEHKRVWELMDALPDPPRQLITTNGTIWTDTVEWVLDRFDVDISISVDAVTAETYQSVRRGGDFETVRRNVGRFAERCAEKGNTLHVSFCLMEETWRELGGFLEWAEQFPSTASVNLVTDHGHALHDLPTSDLEEIAAVWRREDRERSSRLAGNREVWQTQLAQLDAVLVERRAGVADAPRQPEPVSGQLFDTSTPSLAPGSWNRRRDAKRDATRVGEHRSRLEAWSGGGEVAVLRVDEAGLVTEVEQPHRRLGLDAELVGRPVGDVVERARTVDGRPLWLLDHADFDDHSVKTLGLSPTATRGTPGTIVRTIRVPTVAGSVLLIAEDRIYERSEVALAAPRRRGG